MRKKIFLDFWVLISVITATMVFGSCQKGNKDVVVTPDELRFEPGSGTKTLQIETDADWWVESDQSWCNLSTLSGIGTASVNVMVEANTSTSNRTAILTISRGNVDKTIRVTQTVGTQVRFKKEGAYTDVTKIALDNPSSGDYLIVHEFGTASGTSQYYTISAGKHRPVFYYLHPDDGWSWRYYPNDLPSYNFQANCKYTVVLDKDDYVWLSITNDGTY